MQYEEFAPPPSIRDFIVCFWIFAGDQRGLDRIAPDGRCELVIHLANPYAEVSGLEELVQSNALFAGQLTRPLHLRGRGRTWCISARFQPAAAATFLHRPAYTATDRRIPHAEIDPAGAKPLRDELKLVHSDGERVEVLSRYVESRIRRSPLKFNSRVAEAVSLLEAVECPAIASVCAKLGLSMRALQRSFRMHVGVPSQEYSSVVRFRRIFDEMAAAPLSFAQAAQAAGYYDHPQMAREFQRYVGCSARQFVQERDRLAAALTRGRFGVSR